jgi:hypothetical protein
MPDEYTADCIEILTLRESVRRRPCMYAGDTTTGDGALHLVLEVLSNAVDQVMLGRCTRVDIRVDAFANLLRTDDGQHVDGLLDEARAGLRRRVGARRGVADRSGRGGSVLRDCALEVRACGTWR